MKFPWGNYQLIVPQQKHSYYFLNRIFVKQGCVNNIGLNYYLLAVRSQNRTGVITYFCGTRVTDLRPLVVN